VIFSEGKGHNTPIPFYKPLVDQAPMVDQDGFSRDFRFSETTRCVIYFRVYEYSGVVYIIYKIDSQKRYNLAIIFIGKYALPFPLLTQKCKNQQTSDSTMSLRKENLLYIFKSEAQLSKAITVIRANRYSPRIRANICSPLLY